MERYRRLSAALPVGVLLLNPEGTTLFSNPTARDWLVSPRSTVIQTSAVHSGLCADPADALDRLMERVVRSGSA